MTRKRVKVTAKACLSCGKKNTPAFLKCYACGASFETVNMFEKDGIADKHELDEPIISPADVSRGVWVTVKSIWNVIMKSSKYLSKPTAVFLNIIVMIILLPFFIILFIFDRIGKANRK